VSQHEQGDRSLGEHLPRGGPNYGTERSEPVGSLVGAVPDHELPAPTLEVARHRLAHPAQPQETHRLHVSLLASSE
jgi:hypothetical protein